METREDGMPLSKDERDLRRMLGVAVCVDRELGGLYTDDGEMSFSPTFLTSNTFRGGFDFMRSSTDEIQKFIILYYNTRYMLQKDSLCMNL